jgi:hypothetical protein
MISNGAHLSDDFRPPFIDYPALSVQPPPIFESMQHLSTIALKNFIAMMKTTTMMKTITIALVLLILLSCNNKPRPASPKGNDSATRYFGDSIPVSNGLLGRVFLLPDTTKRLPDFDTLKPLANPIYANEINIPWQKWSVGFPGMRDRFEWFGIEYTGEFKPLKPGKYIFKLISDDGSKLFIDDKLVIDNDGIHAEWAERDTLYLSESVHSIKLDYFQGPRYELALQLYWSVVDSPAKIFPGKDFLLYPPKPASLWWLWLLIGLTVIAICMVILKRRR